MTPTIDPVDDIWNYLPDYYPKRQDRDALVARAQADPESCQRRVAIWDFFFPPDRHSLLAPLQAEKAALLAEQRRLKEELAREESRIDQELKRVRELARNAKAEWERWSASIRARVKQGIDKKANLLLAAGISLLLPFGFGFMVLVGEATSKDNFFAGCMAVLVVPPALVGAALLRMAKIKRHSLDAQVADAQSREHGNLSQHLAKLGEEDTTLVSALKNKRAFVAARLIALGDEILHLDRRIATRERQIPEVPSVETVHTWFTEEFKDLEAEIFGESGKQGDLVKRASSATSPSKPICLRGPAELQHRGQINELYLTNADLSKHLTARRAGRDSNGRFVDLYGVWVIEFLFLGNHDFTSARVTLDFITKLKDIQFRAHSYNAVAQVESGYHFRKIGVLRQGVYEEEIIDDIPSISFTLENGQRIDVSFLYPSYLKTAFPGVDPKDRSYEDWEYAKEAVRILRNKVHEARLQAGSQDGGSPGPLGPSWDDLGDPPPAPRPQ